MVLAGLKGPLKALFADRTPPTDLLGLLDLQKCRAGITDREKQLRIFIQTGGLMAPIHRDATPSILKLCNSKPAAAHLRDNLSCAPRTMARTPTCRVHPLRMLQDFQVNTLGTRV
jgi:hypothetical protein